MTFFKKLEPLELPVDYSTLDAIARREVREAYVTQQKGLCYHCHGSLHMEPGKEVTDKRINVKLYPHGFFNHPVHLHHDHKTELTLGAVHAYCNAVLWEYHNE